MPRPFYKYLIEDHSRMEDMLAHAHADTGASGISAYAGTGWCSTSAWKKIS